MLFVVRDRAHLGWQLLPWRAVLIVTVLFVAVFWLGQVGLDDLLASVSGGGEGFASYLRLAGTAALAANVIDNLPAYLALEPAAGDSPARLVAVLIGVNCGPLLTLWASLATLLWRERCRARGRAGAVVGVRAARARRRPAAAGGLHRGAHPHRLSVRRPGGRQTGSTETIDRSPARVALRRDGDVDAAGDGDGPRHDVGRQHLTRTVHVVAAAGARRRTR